MDLIGNTTNSKPIQFGEEVDPDQAGMSRKGITRIVETFEQMQQRGLHPGGQIVVLYCGQVVVDRWFGTADLRRGDPVQADTPFLAFSIAKPFTAACVHRLVEEGRLSLDAPIARYWPEFGCNGKENATVRHALLHQAGVPLRGLLTQIFAWKDWERVTRGIAALPAEFEPGSETAYHLVNFGFILGEVVRRVSGQNIDGYLRQNFLEPLGLKDTSLGLPDAWRDRAAGVYCGHRQQAGAVFLFNRPAIRRAVIPAATLHSTARDLAVFFQMLANGGEYAGQRYLKAETVSHATALSYEGWDRTIGRPMRWAMGFHLGGFKTGYPPEPSTMGQRSTLRTFGHAGQGSSLVWADPDARLVMAFTCNRLLGTEQARLRQQAISDAVWSAIES